MWRRPEASNQKKDKLGSVPRGAPSACVLVCLCVCLASCSGLDMKEEDVWCFMRRVFAYVEVGHPFTRIGGERAQEQEGVCFKLDPLP